MKDKELIFDIEFGKAIMRSALNKVIHETELPACVVEGIIMDLLSEVRAQKAVDLAAFARTQAAEKEERKDNG